MIALYLIAALAVGLALGLLYGGRRAALLSARLDAATAEAERQRVAAEETLAAAKNELTALHSQQLAAATEAHREALAAAEQRGRVAVEAAEKRAADTLAKQEARARETLAATEERHTQAAAAAEARYKETLTTADQRHKEAAATMEQQHREVLTASEQRHKEALAAMEQRFNETLARVSAELRDVTAEMLRQRQKEFTENSMGSLGQIVTPLKETIASMSKAMKESTEQQVALGGKMEANIANMLKQSEVARRSADELARVFKAGSKVQGDWGETVLDELLQANGLTRGIHYDTQAIIRSEDGKPTLSVDGQTLRPDVILHLDKEREVVIDSKVSLSAFFDYVNATDEVQRQRFLRLHVESVSGHVNELARKNYSTYIKPPKSSIGYVIMFMPHAGALLTALNAKPDLWRRAMEQNVFIADEQTLFAALRIVSLTWTQIRQAENHQRVFELANEMLNRVGQFWEYYEKMGKALADANKAYDNGKKKIAEGGVSISTTARQLVKLGAKAPQNKPLPQPVSEPLALES